MNKESVKLLAKRDKIMGRIIERVGPITLKPQKKQTPFAALVEAVVYQQLTGKAAATILGRLKALYPLVKFPCPENFLVTPDEILRGAGLSRAKVAALKDLSAKTLEGVVPTSHAIAKMEDEEIITRLTAIRGVGQWTVEMLLIFKLGREDILPCNDYALRKGFALAYRKKDLPTPRELADFGMRWRPYRTTASWYLWRVLDLPDKKI